MPDEKPKTGLCVTFHHIGETVQIGPDIVITYLGKPNVKSRIGIVAPREIHIRRGEKIDDLGKRQVEAARRLYSPPDRLDVLRWSEYAGELDRIIDALLGRTNPYFGD